MATRFSIVIPTRRRPDTLRHALATALAVEWDDLQIVVQNNGNDPETAAIVRAGGSPRVHLAGTDDVLPMSDNWERALAAATGDYVTVLGDDDGILPDACWFADMAIAGTGAPVLTWRPHYYWWPDTIVVPNRNRLFVTLPRSEEGGEVLHSIPTLEAFYRGALPYSELPMIYSAFVHRSVIEKVRAKAGRYFATLSPDVFSGIANTWAVDRAVRVDRPLSVTGTSRHSIGISGTFRSFRGAGSAIDEFAREAPFAGWTAPELGEMTTLAAGIANEQLLARRILFPDDPRLVVRMEAVLARMAANINMDPASYDDTLADMRALAGKHGIDLSTIPVPPRAPAPRASIPGPLRDESGHVEKIIVDGDRARIANIADAVRLVDAMMFDVRAARRS